MGDLVVIGINFPPSMNGWEGPATVVNPPQDSRKSPDVPPSLILLAQRFSLYTAVVLGPPKAAEPQFHRL